MNPFQQSLKIKLNLESLSLNEEGLGKIQLYAYYGNDSIIPSDVGQYGVAKDVITFRPNHRSGIEYIIKNSKFEVKDKPSRNKRCNSSADRISISKCVANHLEQELNCSTRLLEGNQTMETCGPDLLKNYSKSLQIHQLSEIFIDKTFNCKPSCIRNEVELTRLPNAYDRTKDKGKGIETSLKLEFYFMDGSYEFKEEYYIYDNDSFLADCGGYMGLLLGYSWLSLYQILAEWISKMVVACKKMTKREIHSSMGRTKLNK